MCQNRPKIRMELTQPAPDLGRLKENETFCIDTGQNIMYCSLHRHPAGGVKSMSDAQIATLIFAAPFLALCAIYAIGAIVLTRIEEAR